MSQCKNGACAAPVFELMELFKTQKQGKLFCKDEAEKNLALRVADALGIKVLKLESENNVENNF